MRQAVDDVPLQRRMRPTTTGVAAVTVDPNSGKVTIDHVDECHCRIDGDAIYVSITCVVSGYRVTKSRLCQLRHQLRMNHVDD